MTVAFQIVRYAINLGVTMVLARLIAPVDFGLFAMAATFTGLLVLFKDGGVESALLSHGAIAAHELASLGLLTCLYGFVLALLCAALGPALAWLYHEPRLKLALLMPAIAFLFHGLDVLPSALLLRAHRFRVHAAIETGATLAGWGATLILAWRGASYWALFATELVTAIGLLIGHVWAVRWRPHFSLAWGRARYFVHFARVVTVARALGHSARNVDNLILGIAAGPVSLAFYNRAFRLLSLPHEGINWPLSRLAVPILAQLRDQPAEFARAFRHFNLTSMALGLPGVCFLIVSANEIVAVLYGPQWTEVVPLLRLLGLVGLCHTFLMAPSWVYTARGTVHRQVKWEAVNLVALTAAFLVGARWGATGMALAASIGYGTLCIPSLVYCFRDTPLRLRDLGDVLWRPLLAAGLASGLVLATRVYFGISGPALVVVVRDGVIFCAGYALGWLMVPGWKIFLRHELRRPALPI